MAKFNVGDKVLVKDVCEGHEDIGFTDTMEQHCGTIVTIKKVLEELNLVLSDVVYYIEEDDPRMQFYWPEDWLEPIESTTK